MPEWALQICRGLKVKSSLLMRKVYLFGRGTRSAYLVVNCLHFKGQIEHCLECFTDIFVGYGR